MKHRHPTQDGVLVDDDLQALADEIVANAGVSAATAIQLAAAQRPTLRQYASWWNAAVRRARAAAHEHPGGAAALDVHILSAEFGLIPVIQPIPDYDRRMTAERAHELRAQVAAALRPLLSLNHYASVSISAGKVYRLALDDAMPIFGATPVRMTPESAGIGQQLAALKRWLATSHI